MGLFHLKMACADTIWRIFIQSKKSCDCINSLMQYVSLIQTKETLKIETKPGFRKMHKVIEHIGIVSRLDWWRPQVAKLDPPFSSLEDFAQSEPQWAQLYALAVTLLKEQVANRDSDDLRHRPAVEHDQQRENTLFMEQCFLLYEEMSYAMNEGDIGRVEDTFMPWVFIFKACGKYKYAAHMVKHLHNVHFVYPEGLK